MRDTHLDYMGRAPFVACELCRRPVSLDVGIYAHVNGRLQFVCPSRHMGGCEHRLRAEAIVSPEHEVIWDLLGDLRDLINQGHGLPTSFVNYKPVLDYRRKVRHAYRRMIVEMRHRLDAEAARLTREGWRPPANNQSWLFTNES